MGSSSPPSLECLDFTEDPSVLEPGSEEWKLMGRRLIGALEKHGGVVVEFPSGKEVFDETFSAARDLFDLPMETKLELTKRYPDFPNVLPSYDDRWPFYQALGLKNPLELEEVRAFTQVFWPHGNDKFSNTVKGIGTKLHHLVRVVLEMICDSYGVPRHCDTDHHFIMGKYSVSAMSESGLALNPHFDSNFLTALYSSRIGLQLETREGEWFLVNPLPKGSFVVLVGQALEGWSNGRLHAPLHNVLMTEDSDRFSCGVFLGPKPDHVIEAPRELVDDQHPRVFKTFNYKDLNAHNEANNAFGHSLRMYAGI